VYNFDEKILDFGVCTGKTLNFVENKMNFDGFAN